MKLKVKILKFSAGRPVVIINEKFAAKSSIHVDDRVLLKNDGKSLITVVDVAKDFVGKKEIAVSNEVVKELDLKKKKEVSLEIIPEPKSVQIIQDKLNCKVLSKEEIFTIIKDIVKNALTESEVAYFVSAVYKCGMNLKEVTNMTEAIYKTGHKLGLKNKLIADKHSIGGIPGRTTPILVSICAAAGLIIPKTSSRAITTAAGTADAMEYLCNVEFDVDNLKKIIKQNNACLAWGGSLGLAPADDKIIQVENLLKIDPQSQLIASILAKKLAVGANHLLIDIPYGKNAKVTKKQAENLAKEFIKISKNFGVKTQCILTRSEEPLGHGIGPALEIEDVIKILNGESDCHLLKKKSIALSGKLLELTKKAKKGKGKELATNILDSGKALKKFKDILKSQGGKIKRFQEPKYKKVIKASKNSKILEINTKKINMLARIAGAPLDKLAGAYLHKHLKEKVKKNNPVITIYSESKSELEHAVGYFKKEKPLKLK